MRVFEFGEVEMEMLGKEQSVAIVTSAVKSQLELDGEQPGEIGEGSALLGEEALVDSLGLVNVIIDVEQALLSDHGVSIIVVDERAMSLANSPFKTVSTLADYVVELAAEAS